MIPLWLTFVVIAAALFAFGGLVTTIWTTLRFGQRRRFAPATGSEWQGMQYALLAGMMPWAKESAWQHLGTYFAGVTYHLGIAAAFVVLVFVMAGITIEQTTRLVLLILAIIGAACGIGLLVKRATTLALRAISTPDDVISNLLVTLFVIGSALVPAFPQFTTSFLILTALMLIYVPLGKIRHCFLFFCSRITFGRFFGRRGVLPHAAVHPKESHVSR